MFYGTKKLNSESNVVSPALAPNLPIKLSKGSITWTDTVESLPTGTIKYEGNVESRLPLFESAYGTVKDGAIIKVKINGIHFIVERFGFSDRIVTFQGETFTYYDVQVELRFEYEDKINQPIRVFDIIKPGDTFVTLAQLCKKVKVPYTGPNYEISIPEGTSKNFKLTISNIVKDAARINGCIVVYRKGIELIKVNAGKLWNYPQAKVKEKSQTNFGAVPVIKDALLQGKFDGNLDNLEDLEKQLLAIKIQQFTLKEPKIEEFLEEDDDVELPPLNSEKLKTVDSNSIDGGGPKKVRKLSKTINGKPFKEKIEIWGYKYQAKDLDLIDGSDPKQFWQIIETQNNDYIYENLPGLKIEAIAVNPGGIGTIQLLLHPDYQDVVDVDFGGNSFSLKSNTKYQTQIITNGDRYVRYRPESADLESVVEAEEVTATLYDFKKVPKTTKIIRKLISTRSLLEQPQNQNLPFSVNWTKYEELDPLLKDQVGIDNISNQGLVGVIVPDINYVEPLAIVQETESTIAFTVAPYPDAEIDGQKVVAGEETFNEVKRTRINDSRYSEKITNFTAQNDFEQVNEQIKFREVSGNYPEAEYLIQEWEQKPQNSPTKSAFTSPAQTKEYRVKSDLTTTDTIPTESISAGSATTIAQAKEYIATELRVNGWQTSVSNKTIKWFEPQIKAGDYLNVVKDQVSGKMKIVSVSNTLKFQGTNNLLKELLITCDGTQVTIGRDLNRKIAITKSNEAPDADQNSSANSVQEPKLKIKVIGGEITNTLEKIDKPSRRNF